MDRDCIDAFSSGGGVDVKVEAFLTQEAALAAASQYNRENFANNKKAALVLPGEATFELTPEGGVDKFELKKPNDGIGYDFAFGLPYYPMPDTNPNNPDQLFRHAGFGSFLHVSYAHPPAVGSFINNVEEAAKALVDRILQLESKNTLQPPSAYKS